MFTGGKTRENAAAVAERWREKNSRPSESSKPRREIKPNDHNNIIHIIIVLLYIWIHFLCAHLIYFMVVLSWKVSVVSSYRPPVVGGGLVERKRKKKTPKILRGLAVVIIIISSLSTLSRTKRLCRGRHCYAVAA